LVIDTSDGRLLDDPAPCPASLDDDASSKACAIGNSDVATDFEKWYVAIDLELLRLDLGRRQIFVEVSVGHWLLRLVPWSWLAVSPDCSCGSDALLVQILEVGHTWGWQSNKLNLLEVIGQPSDVPSNR